MLKPTRSMSVSACKHVFVMFLMMLPDGVWRGNKLLNLKNIVDRAMSLCEKRFDLLWFFPKCSIEIAKYGL